jgi:hypothetical protein
MVVFFIFRAVRLSQVEAPKTGAMPHATIVNRSVVKGSVGLIMVSGSILAYYRADRGKRLGQMYPADGMVRQGIVC